MARWVRNCSTKTSSRFPGAEDLSRDESASEIGWDFDWGLFESCFTIMRDTTAWTLEEVRSTA